MNSMDIPEGVKLIAVTKYHQPKQIVEMLQGFPNAYAIAESRLQDAQEKFSELKDVLPSNIQKHFIGRIQTNKLEDIIQIFDVVQSIGRVKELQAIQKAADKLGWVEGSAIDVLLQINVSNDAHKAGFAIVDIARALEIAAALPAVNVIGLMTITAKQNVEDTRRDYATMKTLQLQYGLPELSMGMSADWRVAVEEGATMVRIGTALFAE